MFWLLCWFQVCLNSAKIKYICSHLYQAWGISSSACSQGFQTIVSRRNTHSYPVCIRPAVRAWSRSRGWPSERMCVLCDCRLTIVCHEVRLWNISPAPCWCPDIVDSQWKEQQKMRRKLVWEMSPLIPTILYYNILLAIFCHARAIRKYNSFLCFTNCFVLNNLKPLGNQQLFCQNLFWRHF